MLIQRQYAHSGGATRFSADCLLPSFFLVQSLCACVVSRVKYTNKLLDEVEIGWCVRSHHIAHVRLVNLNMHTATTSDKRRHWRADEPEVDKRGRKGTSGQQESEPSKTGSSETSLSTFELYFVLNKAFQKMRTPKNVRKS
jgi:hypothetical protein